MTQTEVKKTTAHSLSIILALRAVASVVAFGCTLATTRLIVESRGISTFAAISVLITLTSLLPFADLGVGSAVINAASDIRHNPADLSARKTLSASMRVLAVAAVMPLAVGLLLLGMGAWPAFLGASTRSLDDPGGGATAVLAIFGISIALAGGVRILQGWQANAKVVAISALASPIALLITVSILLIHGSSSYLAIATGLAGMVTSLFMWFPVFRRYPGSLLRDLIGIRPSRYEIRSVLGMGLASLVVNLGLVLTFQSHRLLLSHLATSSDLNAYALVAPIYVAGMGIIVPAAQALWPKYRTLRASGKLTHRLFVRDLVFFSGLGLAGGATLIIFGPLLTSIMAPGHSHDVPLSVYVWFAVLVVLQSINLPSGMMLTDGKGFRQQAVVVILMAFFSIAISMLLVPKFGAVGVLSGTCVALGLIQLPANLFLAISSVRGRRAGRRRVAT